LQTFQWLKTEQPQPLKPLLAGKQPLVINIQANQAIVWSLLTNASDFPRWNTTIVSIDGNIALGEKIQLKSTLDTTRTFKLKVKSFEKESTFELGRWQGRPHLHNYAKRNRWCNIYHDRKNRRTDVSDVCKIHPFLRRIFRTICCRFKKGS
jgi:hypothetical protein